MVQPYEHASAHASAASAAAVRQPDLTDNHIPHELARRLLAVRAPALPMG
jgi:hypothetical protein